MSEMTTATPVGVGVDPGASQAIFRAILDGFARPGTVNTLPASTYPAVMLPALALADLETSTHVIEGPDTNWASTLALATGAPAEPLATARFVTVLRKLTVDEFTEVCLGTPLRPESAATVIISVNSLEGGLPVQLIGPGVFSPVEFAPQGIDKTFWKTRRTLVAAFPTGVDLLFVAGDGSLVGVPRTTVVNNLSCATPIEKAN